MLFASSVQAVMNAEKREVIVLLALTALFIVLLILFLLIPRLNLTEPLTEEDRKQILSTGLIFFTNQAQLPSLLQRGLSPSGIAGNDKKSSGVLWLYLFTLETLNERLQRAQKDHPQCDSALLISNIPEPVVGTLRRSRKRPYLIALTEDLKTDQMVTISLKNS